MLDSSLQKALLRSKTLVVVANRGTLQDPRWVRKEVEDFRTHRSKRPVIAINVGRALEDESLAEGTQQWLGHEGKIWLDETEEAVAKGIASDQLVKRLATAPKRVKTNVKWRWVVGCVMVVLATLAIGLGIFAKVARDRAQIALSRQLAAQSTAELMHDRQTSLLLAIQANRAARTYQADEALANAALAYPHRDALGRSGGPLWALALSPDGRLVVTASKDGSVQCWAVGTGELLANLSDARGPLYELSFSPDGALILGTGEGFIRVWNTDKLVPVESDLNRISDVSSARFSPSGKFIVTGLQDGTASVWELHSGRRIVEVRAHLERLTVAGPAFSPDEASIVTAGADGIARIWSIPSGKLVAELKGHTHRLLSAEFSPDGYHVVTAASPFPVNAEVASEERRSASGPLTGVDNTVRIWDLNNTREMASIHNFVIERAVFAPGGKVVAVNLSGGTMFYNLAGERIGDGVDGRLASFSFDGSLFATIEGNETVRIRRMADYEAVAVFPGQFGLFSQDRRRLLTASPAGSVFIWNLDQDLGSEGLRQSSKEFLSASFSHNGAMIATIDKDGMAQLWDGNSGAEVTSIKAPDLSSQRIHEASFGNDDLLLTLDLDGQALVRNLTSGKISRFDFPFPIEQAEFSPDGSRVLTRSKNETGSPCNLQLWSSDTGSKVAEICLMSERLPYARFGSDGAWIETHTASGAQIWHGHDGHRIAEFPGDDTYIRGSNSKWVITGKPGKSVSMWDARTGRQVRELSVFARADMTSTGTEAMFSPDGSLVVTLGEPIRIWDAATGEKMADIAGARRATFSPDGQMVATSCDGGICASIPLNDIWDARTGRILAKLEPGLGGTVAFSMDGKWLVGTGRNEVGLWEVRPDKS